MAGEFIPFAPGGKPALRPGNAAGQFAPLTANAGNASANVSLSTRQTHHRAVHHGEISIDIKRNGDSISEIHIRCRCGELIELKCEY